MVKKVGTGKCSRKKRTRVDKLDPNRQAKLPAPPLWDVTLVGGDSGAPEVGVASPGDVLGDRQAKHGKQGRQGGVQVFVTDGAGGGRRAGS